MVPGEDKCISNTYRCWEVQEGDAGIGSVRGRLGACVLYWEEVLCAPFHGCMGWLGCISWEEDPH